MTVSELLAELQMWVNEGQGDAAVYFDDDYESGPVEVSQVVGYDNGLVIR